ncbi:MAG: hypothetical protein AAGE52_02125 [Myxococcota bacterium]
MEPASDHPEDYLSDIFDSGREADFWREVVAAASVEGLARALYPESLQTTVALEGGVAALQAELATMLVEFYPWPEDAPVPDGVDAPSINRALERLVAVTPV